MWSHDMSWNWPLTVALLFYYYFQDLSFRLMINFLATCWWVFCRIWKRRIHPFEHFQPWDEIKNSISKAVIFTQIDKGVKRLGVAITRWCVCVCFWSPVVNSISPAVAGSSGQSELERWHHSQFRPWLLKQRVKSHQHTRTKVTCAPGRHTGPPAGTGGGRLVVAAVATVLLSVKSCALPGWLPGVRGGDWEGHPSVRPDNGGWGWHRVCGAGRPWWGLSRITAQTSFSV